MSRHTTCSPRQLSNVTDTGLFKGLVYVFIYYKGHVFVIEGRVLTGLARSKQSAAIYLQASLALLVLQYFCCQESQTPALA